jgi:hypothetical protein
MYDRAYCPVLQLIARVHQLAPYSFPHVCVLFAHGNGIADLVGMLRN